MRSGVHPDGAADGIAALRALRATRRFLPDAVPASVLTEVVDVARWTGSARNRQPWRLVAVDDAPRRSALARLGAYAHLLADAPLVLLLAVDQEAGGADAEFDAGRFAQTLMLAAHLRGLGSCPVTFFPTHNAERATAVAGVSPPWHVRTAIAVGYPDRTPRPATDRSAIPTGRLPLEVIRDVRRDGHAAP